MSVVDKLLNYMKIGEEVDDGDDYDSDYDEDDEEPVRIPRKASVKKAAPVREEEDFDDDEDDEPVVRKPARPAPAKVTSIQQGRKPVASNGMEVCIIRPNSFEEAKEVTDTLMKNRTVVMNLEGLEVEVAQRIIDFVSGSCYAINGNLQKIVRYVFIITPSNVDVSGDLQEMFGDFDSTIFSGSGM